MSVIRDVAKAAGVSVATVSRVINGQGNVREETSKRVRAAIEALDYQPNTLGRNLRLMETRKIMVLVSDLSNSFHAKVIAGIEAKAEEEGYHMMVCTSHGKLLNELAYIELLKDRTVDGVVLMQSAQSVEALNELVHKFPVVQCCEYQEGVETSSVAIDDKMAGEDAAAFLLELGHERIAYVGTEIYVFSERLRREGFLTALERAGKPVSPEYIFLDSYSAKSGIRTADKIAKLKEKPTAIFTVADNIAIGLMRGLMSCGIRVPEDISVVGFDNTFVSEMYYPSLTTIAQPRKELGETAMALLLEKIRDINAPNQKVRLGHTVIERESTRKECPK